MANPQPNQFTRISNELMEMIPFYKFNGTQLRILFILIRYTYGYNRKDCDLSLSFLSKATGIHKDQAKRELKVLIDHKVVTVVKEADFNTPRVIGLNKDYDQWLVKKNVPNNIQVANMSPGSEKAQGTDSPPGGEKGHSQGTDSPPLHSEEEFAQNSDQPSNDAAPARVGADSPPGSEKAHQERNVLKKTLKKNKVPNGTLNVLPNPAVKNVLLYYAEEFKNKFGEDPVIDWGKDGKIIKDLLKPKSEEQLKAYLDAFFKSTDDWIRQSNYGIGVFKTQINKLIAEQSNKSQQKHIPRGFQTIYNA
ncbi:Bacteriophage replication protein O [Pelotomaculum sp. FP]|uniref:replication protein n=1 Tax=Pelotomaculum sp. FP TaxID=261474 RepID=UPI001066B1BA|nr:replication protein [Pelotomaculum sp. FP]TEB15157.1 Bacteriophage replication protein O [Pelotomaculum sp. FP]